MNDYHSYISDHSPYVPADHLREVNEAINRVKSVEATLKSDYAELLKNVRTGNADPEELWGLYSKFHSGDSAVKNLVAVTKKYFEKIEFIDTIVAEGARYIGYNGLLLDTELPKSQSEDVYVFYFNESVRQERESRTRNFSLLLDMLREDGPKKPVLVVDRNAKEMELNKSKIVQYRNLNIIVDDVLEQQKLLKGHAS